MIGPAMLEMLMERKEKYLIPAEVVAHVQQDNHLDHALLVLTKVRYAKIPVLDSDFHFKGLLSMPMITETMLGLEQLSTDNLSNLSVKDVMETDIATIENPYDLEEVMHLLVDQAFIPVVDKDGSFTGIVTRREYMKTLNRITHQFEQDFDVFEKEAVQTKADY